MLKYNKKVVKSKSKSFLLILNENTNFFSFLILSLCAYFSKSLNSQLNLIENNNFNTT